MRKYEYERENGVHCMLESRYYRIIIMIRDRTRERRAEVAPSAAIEEVYKYLLLDRIELERLTLRKLTTSRPCSVKA